MYANAQISNHNRLAQTQDPDALRHALEMETKLHEGFFSETLAGKQLIQDNDNFAFALVNEMPPSEVAKLIKDMKVPKSAPYEFQKALVALAFSEIANGINISMRQELTRVALSNVLVAETAAEAAQNKQLAGLGIFIEAAIIKFIQDAGVKSLPDFFEKLGKSIGKSLRSFGEGIMSFRDLLIDKWGVFGRYFADFVVLTPGGKFVLGDLAIEVGMVLETGDFTWERMAAAGSQYMKDMALILQVVGVVAPPPWNLIAKLIAVIYKAASKVIDWKLREHIKNMLAEAEEANRVAREAFEAELMAFVGNLYASIPPSTSEYGSNSTVNPEGGSAISPVMLIAGIGLAALLLMRR